MNEREQARAILLLRRWRDQCLTSGNGSLDDEVTNMTALYIETNAFVEHQDAGDLAAEIAIEHGRQRRS
jgi:hypothetical protein